MLLVLAEQEARLSFSYRAPPPARSPCPSPNPSIWLTARLVSASSKLRLLGFEAAFAFAAAARVQLSRVNAIGECKYVAASREPSTFGRLLACQHAMTSSGERTSAEAAGSRLPHREAIVNAIDGLLLRPPFYPSKADDATHQCPRADAWLLRKGFCDFRHTGKHGCFEGAQRLWNAFHW